MLIQSDNQSGEQAMQGHWQYDGSMYGALDKTKGQWPSSVYVSMHTRQVGAAGCMDLRGFCLVEWAKGMVGFRR